MCTKKLGLGSHYCDSSARKLDLFSHNGVLQDSNLELEIGSKKRSQESLDDCYIEILTLFRTLAFSITSMAFQPQPHH